MTLSLLIPMRAIERGRAARRMPVGLRRDLRPPVMANEMPVGLHRSFCFFGLSGGHAALAPWSHPAPPWNRLPASAPPGPATAIPASLTTCNGDSTGSRLIIQGYQRLNESCLLCSVSAEKTNRNVTQINKTIHWRSEFEAYRWLINVESV